MTKKQSLAKGLRLLGAGSFVILGSLGAGGADSGAAVSGLWGLEIIEAPLPVFDGRQQRHFIPTDQLPPIEVWLSRCRYWQQDGHLDAVVRLSPPDDIEISDTTLMVEMRDQHGDLLLRLELGDLPGRQFAFYPALPEGWTGEGKLALRWQMGERLLASDKQSFRVERFDEPVERTGRVPIDIRNDSGVVQTGLR